MVDCLFSGIVNRDVSFINPLAVAAKDEAQFNWVKKIRVKSLPTGTLDQVLPQLGPDPQNKRCRSGTPCMHVGSYVVTLCTLRSRSRVCATPYTLFSVDPSVKPHP